MKVMTEISDCFEEEIIIRCKERTEYIASIENLLKRLVGIAGKREMVLYSSGVEYYIPLCEILYFESNDGKVYAHTARSVYATDKKLFELEEVLPPNFVRIAKSTIANIDLVSSLRRELVGNGEMYFKNSEKRFIFRAAIIKL